MSLCRRTRKLHTWAPLCCNCGRRSCTLTRQSRAIPKHVPYIRPAPQVITQCTVQLGQECGCPVLATTPTCPQGTWAYIVTDCSFESWTVHCNQPIRCDSILQAITSLLGCSRKRANAFRCLSLTQAVILHRTAPAHLHEHSPSDAIVHNMAVVEDTVASRAQAAGALVTLYYGIAAACDEECS